MPKKKLPQTIEECNAELERTQKQLQQYENRDKMRQLPQQYGKLLLYAKRNFFEYFFHLYNNFSLKHKLAPFIPYRCFREPLNQSAAALSGSFASTFRFENFEIRKAFLRFPNLDLEQNPSLTALAIESEVP